jgi:signal peptide peptidase-like 3
MEFVLKWYNCGIMFEAVDYLLVVIVATCTVAVGTWVSTLDDLSQTGAASTTRSEQHQEITSTQALVFPLTASASLIILFFFFDYIQYLLVFVLVASSSSALYQLLDVWFAAKLEHHANPLCKLVVPYLNGAITALVVIEWARTGNPFCHNLLGCALCVMFISTLQFPSLKIATLCLSLLLVYDLFWVFFSEYIFSANVMVAVATKQASNPVHDLGELLNIPVVQNAFSVNMELPLKLIFRSFSTERTMMLGLGDIALPGALVSLARKFDIMIGRNSILQDDKVVDLEVSSTSLVERRKQVVINPQLYGYAILGYFFSLCLAFVFNSWSGHPQPALIYLVPGVLLPIFWRAYSMGKLTDAWVGRFKLEFSQ